MNLPRVPQWLSGQEYNYRKNSLNMFRLILAGMVLYAHSYYIVGVGEGPHLQGENYGGWAVAGFFVLSGFLITRSRLRSSAAEYLLHRIARIYPAFFVMLVVTAAVFGPLALLLQGKSLTGYISTPVTPAEYVWGNLGLNVAHYSIGTTLAEVPYPNVWNGSMWTLYFEFLSYLVVWVLGFLAIYRKSMVPALVVFIASVAVYANQSLFGRLGLDVNFLLLAKLLPFFLGGSIAFMFINRFGMNRWIGIACLGIAAVIIAAVPGWGGQASSPFLAYGLLFLSVVIPQPSVIATHDVSYGFYIYAWPVQQFCVILGVHQLGLRVYMPVAALITLVLAAMSWLLVERPVMRRVRGRKHAAPVASAAPS